MSLRRKHFLLSLVSVVCILASVLNIAVAGSFSTSFVNISEAVSVSSNYTNTSFSPDVGDMLQMAIDLAVGMVLANVSGDTGLSSFQTAEFAFPPAWARQDGIWYDGGPTSNPLNSTDWEAPARADFGNGVVSTTSWGVGVSLNCTEIAQVESFHHTGIVQSSINLTDRAAIGEYTVQPALSNGNDNGFCEFSFEIDLTIPTTRFATGTWNGTLTPNESSDPRIPCSHDMVLLHSNPINHEIGVHLCHPHINAHHFDLELHLDGTILSSSIKTNTSVEKSSPLANMENLLTYFSYAFLVTNELFARTTTISS